MLEFSLRGVRIRLTFGFFAALGLTASLGGEGQADLLTVLLCSAMHEAGHIAAMLFFGIPPESVTFFAGGIALPAKSLECPIRQACVILSAGPAVNLTAAAAGILAEQTGIFTAASLGLGLFNLMPFRCFDGGQLYTRLRGREPPRLMQTAALFTLLIPAVLSAAQGSIPLPIIIVTVFVLTDIK